MDTKVYLWQGTLCIEDGEPFEMAGLLVQPVRANEPIFRTDPRPNHPCIATPYGWVVRDELVEIDPVAYLTALHNWTNALDDAERMEGMGLRAAYFQAEQYAQECGLVLGRLVAGVQLG
jgi:hypothetical protein